MTSRLREALGVELPLHELFAAPRLADLAVRVEAALGSGKPAAAPPLVPMSKGSRDRALPLSFGQERLWLIDQLEPGSPRYNIPAALRVEGPLDSAVLAATLGEIVRRHEALRTVFARRADGPAQVVQPAGPFGLAVVDLSGLPESAREALAEALAGEEAGRPFDLQTSTVARSCAVCCSAWRSGITSVLLTLHHIAGDGWSIGVLVREVAALYPALSEGAARRPSPLPELPVQYADFAVWQRSWLVRRGPGAGARLVAPPARRGAAAPQLPTDRPRPPVQSFRGRGELFALPGDARPSPPRALPARGGDPFMTFSPPGRPCWRATRGSATSRSGTPIAGRTRREVEELIGFFLNTLVLADLGPLGRARASAPSSAACGRAALAAYAHQEVPFELLVEALQPERSLAFEPLFQVVLNLHNMPRATLSLPGLTWRPVEVAPSTVQFDLILTVREEEGGLACQLDYRTDLFDRSTVRRMAGHSRDPARHGGARAGAFSRRAAAPRPQPSGTSSWPSGRDRAGDGGDPRGDGLPARDLRGPGPARAAGSGGGDGSREPDLRRARPAGRTAWPAVSRRLGVGPEVVVGICLERSLELVVAILGVLKAGGAYLPLDPAYPQERLLYLLADSAAPVVVTRSEVAPALAGSAAARLYLDEEPERRVARRGRPVVSGAGPENLAYVIYTSGSTGRPRGS